MSAVWNILLEQGEDWDLVLTCKDDAGPLDLTGFSARMQIRETVGSPAPLVSFSSAPGGHLTVYGSAGVIALSVPASETSAWTWHYGVYNLEIESAGGKVRRLLRGEVLMDREVVR